MDTFWQTAVDLPAGSGFSLFGPAHLCWLGGLVLAGFLLCRYGRARAKLFSRIMACLLPVTEIWKDLFLLGRGEFWAGNLPFYLCGFAMFLILLDAFWPQPVLLEILYGLSLPGTCGALLFPDWTAQPPFCFVSAQSFVFHGLLALYIVFQLACGRRPQPVRGFFSCVGFVLLFAPLTKYLDGLWGTNYFFLEYGPAGSPLAWVQQQLGGAYLVGYTLFGLALIETMYLPLQRMRRHRRR